VSERERVRKGGGGLLGGVGETIGETRSGQERSAEPRKLNGLDFRPIEESSLKGFVSVRMQAASAHAAFKGSDDIADNITIGVRNTKIRASVDTQQPDGLSYETSFLARLTYNDVLWSLVRLNAPAGHNPEAVN
jgi:hypothetical protein